jgi:hypothetical protein
MMSCQRVWHPEHRSSAYLASLRRCMKVVPWPCLRVLPYANMGVCLYAGRICQDPQFSTLVPVAAFVQHRFVALPLAGGKCHERVQSRAGPHKPLLVRDRLG